MSFAPRAEPIRLAVLNDFEVVALGVAAMLADYPHRVRVVGVNVHLYVPEPVDIVLYDAFARTTEGVDLDLGLVTGNALVDRTVLYTWQVTPESVRFAERRGLAGVVSKSVRAGRLVEALERIHLGENVILTADDDEPYDDQPTWNDWPGRVQGLTPRQSEIVTMIVAGQNNKAIAKSCYLSSNSVKSYIRAAYRTMGVCSRTQAVLWGIDHGFRSSSQPRFMVFRDDEAPASSEGMGGGAPRGGGG
ncbi:helix-turn-helix transcriptional regulator [Janibacter melonis]|uniref:helix-turn-helix transcriptional regulator n=1 Tax=Janibacter melonis TaxID=262209 RepID=UPI00191898A5|nr:response regulator transcription factor [Janibacter melonis]